MQQRVEHAPALAERVEQAVGDAGAKQTAQWRREIAGTSAAIASTIERTTAVT